MKSSITFEAVGGRVGCRLFLKCGLPGFGTCEVRWRDGPFFCERMAEERDVMSVEEVEDTVVDVTFFRAEFINAILQIICLRTPEFMTPVF
jgi:hypothetical protein